MWLLALLCFLVFGTIASLERRKFAKTQLKYIFAIQAIWYIAFLYPAGLVYAYFSGADLAIGWSTLALVVLTAFAWPLSGLMTFKTNHYLDAGVFQILKNMSPIVASILAIILLGDSLSALQVLGGILIIASGVVVVISGDGFRLNHEISRKGVYWALATGAAVGLAVVIEKSMLNRIDLGAYMVYGWGGQTLWAFAFNARHLGELKDFVTKDRHILMQTKLYMTSGVLRSFGFLAALALASASLVSIGGSLLTVTVVIAAYFYINERDHMRQKIIGALIGVAGLILIAL